MSFIPPSNEEKEIVQKLKDRLHSTISTDTTAYQFTDTSILRFYRGRKNDEEKAFKALIKHLEWREANAINNIITNQNIYKKELESGKISVQGYDKMKRPAVFIYAARHNKNERDLEELKQLIIYTLELIIKMASPDEERMVIVFDLSGFGMNCMDYEALKLLVDILSFNYPETLAVAYVVNAPFLFWGCWGLIKPWLDPVTASKVKFIKKENLINYFDESVLLQTEERKKHDIHKSMTAATEMNSVASESVGDLTAMDTTAAAAAAATTTDTNEIQEISA